MECVQACRQPGRTKDPDAPWWVQVPAQVVAERHKIHEVVRMQVRDEDPVQAARIKLVGQARERSLAQVQEDRAGRVADEIGGPGRSDSVRERRAGSQDDQLERAWIATHRMDRSGMATVRPARPTVSRSRPAAAA